ncbi:siderophore-interacting protein [Streptomyces triticagri]|nr:siderophore-interacting protein [Streptomyces triticagri]
MTTNDAAATGPSSIADEVAEVNPRYVEHFNGTYADAVEIVCRAHFGRDDLHSAKFAGIDVHGPSLRATTEDGVHHEAAVPFSRPVATLFDIQSLTLEVTARARDALGITAPTTPERQAQQVNAIRTRVTSVVRVEQVTPIFKQITFGGGDLGSYTPGGHDQFIYVMTPPAGRTELTVDSSFSQEDFGRFAEEDRPIGGYYTLRRWRPEVAEIDMLFVLHGIGDDTHTEPGPSATWAAGAAPGDPVALWGPRTIYEPPADTDWLLLVGDETGLPAICVILENLPEGTPAHVFVELGDDADRLPLPDRPDIHVTWLIRGDAPAGTTTLLHDAVRALDHPDGNVYAWGGAESRSMAAIRKHLRRERRIDRTRVRMTGYWRHTSTPADVDTDES